MWKRQSEQSCELEGRIQKNFSLLLHQLNENIWTCRQAEIFSLTLFIPSPSRKTRKNYENAHLSGARQSAQVIQFFEDCPFPLLSAPIQKTNGKVFHQLWSQVSIFFGSNYSIGDWYFTQKLSEILVCKKEVNKFNVKTFTIEMKILSYTRNCPLKSKQLHQKFPWIIG